MHRMRSRNWPRIHVDGSAGLPGLTALLQLGLHPVLRVKTLTASHCLRGAGTQVQPMEQRPTDRAGFALHIASGHTNHGFYATEESSSAAI